MRKRHIVLLIVPLVFLLTGCPLFNKLPVWSTIADFSKNIGDILELNLAEYCTDPDGDSLDFSLVSGPGSVVGSLYSWTVTAPTGLKTIEVAASDGKGESKTSFKINVKSPPNIPSDPSPAHNADGQSFASVTLSWTGGDPDGDPVTYDLYFGASPNPPIHSTNLTTTSFVKVGLKSFTDYYWKIVSKDGSSLVEGPIWKFKTEPYGIVNDNFESRPLGVLGPSTLPWGDYDSSDLSKGAITLFGFAGSRGLTLSDPTVDGYARVLRTGLSPASRGMISFDFRVAANGCFGVGDRTDWAPYILCGDYGEGFGLYTFSGSYKRLMLISPNTWYTVLMEFDFNFPYRGFSVHVNGAYKGAETYTVILDFTQFEFLVFSSKMCDYVDFDNVYIGIFESGYTTSDVDAMSSDCKLSTELPLP